MNKQLIILLVLTIGITCGVLLIRSPLRIGKYASVTPLLPDKIIQLTMFPFNRALLVNQETEATIFLNNSMGSNRRIPPAIEIKAVYNPSALEISGLSCEPTSEFPVTVVSSIDSQNGIFSFTCSKRRGVSMHYLAGYQKFALAKLKIKAKPESPEGKTAISFVKFTILEVDTGQQLAMKTPVVSFFIRHSLVTTTPLAQKAILMIWDGVQKNDLDRLLVQQLLPNLTALIQQGVRRDMVVFTNNCLCSKDGDNYHTETAPAHAAILSGYGFPTMLTHSNYSGWEESENDCRSLCVAPTSPAGPTPTLANLPCFQQLAPRAIPPGYTFFERLKEFNPQAKTGMIAGKNFPLYFPQFKYAAPSTCCSPRYPYLYVCGSGNALDVCYPPSGAESDQVIGSRFLNFIEENRQSPFFLVAHLGSPDHAGHDHTENSPEYDQTIIEADRQLGRIMAKLTELNLDGETAVLVTTDHGFEEGGINHHACVVETKETWIAANQRYLIGNPAVVAKQTSIVPALFDIFGMDKEAADPLFAGESLVDVTRSQGGGDIGQVTPTPCLNPPVPQLRFPQIKTTFSAPAEVSLVVDPVDSRCGNDSTEYLFKHRIPGGMGLGKACDWSNRSVCNVTYIQSGTRQFNVQARVYDSYYHTYRESLVSPYFTYTVDSILNCQNITDCITNDVCLPVTACQANQCVYGDYRTTEGLSCTIKSKRGRCNQGMCVVVN